MDWVSTHLYEKAFRAQAGRYSKREHDYCVDGLKFVGNSQSLAKDKWLHHSSILWDCDLQLMSSVLKIPEKQPDYRQNREHCDFLTTLKHSQVFQSPEHFFQQMEGALGEIFEIEHVSWEDLEQAVKEQSYRISTKYSLSFGS